MVRLGPLFAVIACGPSVGDPATSAVASSSSSSETGRPVASGSSAGTVTTGPVATSTSADGGSSSGPPVPGSSTGGDTTGELACIPECRSSSECNDGLDNDGDGVADSDDPECLTPCHDDEQSTHHGFPSDAADCFADCVWDDNIGIGDDGCRFQTPCDPLGPETEIFCPPAEEGSPMCQDLELFRECLPACLPMTPPGCDCFGCCTFPTPRGPEDRWVTDYDCTLDDPSMCAPCTQNETCVELCDDPCEWCFGMIELPAGCAEATCDFGSPCTAQCDCAEGFGCQWGCCRPLTVGLIP